MVIKKDKSHPKISFGKNGILIINLGTPKSTKKKDIKVYLREFLSDRRIIEVNKILWFFILNLIILNFRPNKTAKAYKEIWMKDVDQSPLRYYTILQKKELEKKIGKSNIIVDYAMRYGEPNIEYKINYLKEKGCENIIILPLYPQYSSATTGSVCDAVFSCLLKLRWQPSIQIVPHYESNPLYIKALSNSLKKALSKINWVPDYIIASYHGIPKRYFINGDPYHCYCIKTTRLLKEQMSLNTPIITTFQSRFGPEDWLQPYTEEKLIELAKDNKKNVLVICPGFSSDCIETLEEIGLRAKETFISNGGNKFELVPCLNDNKDHINLLDKLTKKYLINA
tara:strand:- start:830 stop:1846 length:1017 start_codon:yes stop_codon:yes gene_type:complete